MSTGIIPDLASMHHETLIDLIRLCQKELEKRGTVTQCFNVFYTEAEGQRTILITDNPKRGRWQT